MELTRELIQSPYMKKYFNNKLQNLDKLQLYFYDEPTEKDNKILYDCISSLKDLRSLDF